MGTEVPAIAMRAKVHVGKPAAIDAGVMAESELDMVFNERRDKDNLLTSTKAKVEKEVRKSMFIFIMR